MIPKPHRASIVYYVADIVRTERFYTETLGIALSRMEGAEPFWLQGGLDQGWRSSSSRWTGRAAARRR